jgi:phage tail-like protein
MDDLQTRYALLRDGPHWDAITTTRLQTMLDGALTLARVPGPADGKPIALPGPYDAPASGLAVGDCGDRYLTDTANHRLVWTDGLCGARMVLPGVSRASGAAPGHFDTPRALLIGPSDRLYVADSGHGRVQIFRLPTLEVHASWEGPLHTPTGLAVDSQGRVYVLDRGLQRVLRFSAWGSPDAPYNGAMSAPAGLTSPAFLAVATGDTLYISDDGSDSILRFDAEGQPLGALPAATSAPFRPRALVAGGDRLYVADAASGAIWVFDRPAGEYLGTVAGYRGPVTALAVNPSGALYIKSGLDETTVVLAADAAYVPAGQLASGRLDAGEQGDWVRVAVAAELPPGTGVQLQLFATGDATAVPAEPDWFTAAALDTLVWPYAPAGNGQPGQHRYLWLRLLLSSNQGGASPQIRQVQAETAGEEYMDYLPSLYRREDAQQHFLRRWLALLRAQLGDLELVLLEMPQRFDPTTTPADHLEWLASWLAFDLPMGWEAESLRELLAGVHKLYGRRGSRFGVSEFVHLYTGARPQILEAFQERRFWLLDHTSRLGFDTGLAPLAAEGIVVADETVANALATPDAADDLAAWTTPAGLVVGEVVVGHNGPLAATDLGEPLFADTAHRFTVLVPAAQAPTPAQRQALRAVIEAEKPAYSDYHLCFVTAHMQVGFQARIGIDSIIAGPPDPMILDETTLGFDSTLGEGEEGASRVGQRARLGHDLVIQ